MRDDNSNKHFLNIEITNDLHPDIDILEQQFTSDANPRYVGQLFVMSHIRFVLHSLLESQSPSSSEQGLLSVQRSSSRHSQALQYKY